MAVLYGGGYIPTLDHKSRGIKASNHESRGSEMFDHKSRGIQPHHESRRIVLL